MHPEEPFDAWKRSRAGADVPDGFADRVMEAVLRSQAGSGSPARWLSSRWFQVAAVLLATLAGALRIACLLDSLIAH